jgi:alanyl-tRNA synthetase
MTSKEIREKFLEFFKGKGHTIIPSASLVPRETDPTVLFTTAGMHPLVPYLLGEDHPGGKRVANVQKCIRTIDIDKVGDESHLTFFEMLGNWSFGDYFKREAIEWSFEFLTSQKCLGIDKDRLSVTVFAGDKDAPRDDESAKIWQSLGIPKERIFYKGKEDNWWGPAGAAGPCGPDTEIFINGTEIWNDVFMEYNKTVDGKYEPLKQKNVDTGMGLERMAMIMQGKNNVYETDLFAPIIESLESKVLCLKTDDSRLTTSKRIIADHIKASVFISADGVEPSNVGRGYVLRRLIRRAIRHGKLLGMPARNASHSDAGGEKDFTPGIAKVVIDIYKDVYPELEKNKEKIFEELEREEKRFKKTLERGLKEFEKGTDPFILFTTYGFPIELTQEMAKERGIEINIEKFKKQLKAHQELSRTASAGMFKGGLADAGEQTIKYHTATHLLLAALRKVLGPHVFQRGSNITAERLRFDFNHHQKMTKEEIKKCEDLVNEKIKKNLPVLCEEMTVKEAKEKGAIGVFEEKYGDRVKVYSIGDFSMEICAGPHVKATAVLGHFKIVKEEAVSAGVRRIKAVLVGSK